MTAVFCTGCAGGQQGDANKLRFGQIYYYAESTDFTTAIAVGQPMPLGLQATTRKALLNDYDYLDGTLDVLDAKESKLAVTRLSAGRFQTVFPKAGSYTLVGANAGVEDRLTVTAVDQTGVRLAKGWTVSSTATDRGCKPAQPAAGALPVLKKNQSMNLAVIAQSAAGAPLLGLLDLGAEASGCAVETTLGINAGSYVVQGRSNDPSTHCTVTFTDKTTKQAFKLELDLAPDQTETCAGT